MRIDCFPFRDELDILEMRLTELDKVIDRFVLVEATVTHGHNQPKPLVYAENQERFAAWSDRIVHVVADGLPADPDPWSREIAQRDWIWEGLRRIDAQPDDIVFQSDVDEIPRAFYAQLTNPRGFVVFEQRLHSFAIDWLHPEPWRGTVAARVRDIDRMASMRDARFTAPVVLPDAGWHFSWLGGVKAAEDKMGAFCHPEIEPEWGHRLEECWRTGIHVDGTQMRPVDVDETWPRWIVAGNAPQFWYRPR